MQSEVHTAEPDAAVHSNLIPVDPEPVTLRLLLIAIFLGGTVLGYIITNNLFPGQGLNFIAIGGGVAIGGALMWGGERLIKPNWPATRFVEVTDVVVRIVKHGETEHHIDAQQHVNVLAWYFEVAKRAHVPKGWYVIALALEQEDNYIPVYTFVPPEDFKLWNEDNAFTQLQKLKKDDENSRERGDLRMAGQQRRLRVAEGARVFHGAEMTTENFKLYTSRLMQNFAGWMPKLPEV